MTCFPFGLLHGRISQIVRNISQSVNKNGANKIMNLPLKSYDKLKCFSLCLYTQTSGVIKKNLLIFFSNNLAFSTLKMWILESKIAEINSQLHYSLCDLELIDWLWSSASLPNDKILARTSQCCEAHRQDAAYRAWHTADNCSINANNNLL